MPEGDTIYRAARVLDRALAGKKVTRFESVFPALLRVDDQAPLRGRTIERARAVGKHLLIDFSGGLTLRTHMRMNGSWHVYRPGERWQRPRRDMRIVIATDDAEAVGFTIPVAEFGMSSATTRLLDELGPDVLTADFDEAEALRRVRNHDGEEIANVLLNQHVIAGIGNIWKSESLFAAKVNPFARTGDLDDATLQRIIRYARRLMRRSATEQRYRFEVYERAGQLCRKCGARIEYRKQGADARGTYWCVRCQAVRPLGG